MARTAWKGWAVLLAAASLAACSSTPSGYGPVTVPTNAGIYKVGQPYQIDGTWYYPREQPDYDETGVASWYGPSFYGQKTANGEIFDASAITGAHRTLPMPVNVRVTNLENGKSLVVRVNDRGPFARGRIIDLSEQAAKLLGFYGKGTARVRVTYVSRADLPGTSMPAGPETPPAIANALPAAPAGTVQVGSLDTVAGAPQAPPVRTETLPQPVAAPSAADQADVQPTGQVTQVPVPAITHLYVQVGAFGNRENADRLRGRLAATRLSISPIDRKGQRLYRVRLGPFDDVGDADSALTSVVKAGGTDAKIVVDQ